MNQQNFMSYSLSRSFSIHISIMRLFLFLSLLKIIEIIKCNRLELKFAMKQLKINKSKYLEVHPSEI